MPVDPFNYAIQVRSPLQSALASFTQQQQGAQQQSDARVDRRNLQEDRQFLQQQRGQQQTLFAQGQQDRAAGIQVAQQQAAQAAQARRQLQGLANNPNSTAKDYVRFSLSHPELGAKLKDSIAHLDDQEKASSMQTLSQAYAAVTSGRPDVAEQLLQDRIDASKASGLDQQAAGAQAMLNTLKSDPNAAKMMLGLSLAAIDPDFAGNFTTLEESRREDALAPANMQKILSEVGLTKAQIAKTIVETKTAQAKLNALADGPKAEPEQVAKLEKEARNEIEKRSIGFAATQDAYGRINAAQDTPAGDISLIISFMKMLDPGSVVREGEFATAQNAAGVPERIRNIYNQMKDGTRLTETQRSEFKSQAFDLFDVAAADNSVIMEGYQKLVENQGLNPENVFILGIPGEEADATSPDTNKALTPDDEANTFFGGGQ
jgi:hypothetical protein